MDELILSILSPVTGKSMKDVRQEVHQRTDKDVSLGAVAVCLDRLEDAGLVEWWEEDRKVFVPGYPTVKLYKLTTSGLRRRAEPKQVENPGTGLIPETS